jgi:hypothetical protein
MNSKSKYVIEKDVPIPKARGEKLYEYYDIPFDQMKAGDSVSISFQNLIPNNSHPDSRERQSAVNTVMAYLKRKFRDWQFKSRQDTPVSGRYFSRESMEKAKEYNLNRRFRIWRIK